MHQSHAWLSQRLPVPVINPGPLSYKMAEAALGLGLSHSRQGYPKPMHPRLDMLQAMMSAAQQAVR
jgi:allantoin racemase